MKAYITILLGLLLVADFAMAQRGRGNRTRINEKKVEEQKRQENRAKKGFQNTSRSRSENKESARLEAQLQQAATNSKGLLRSVDGLVELAKANPSQKLAELVDSMVQRKVELETSSREIDIARKEALDSALTTLETAAKEIQNNRSFLNDAKKEDLKVLTDFHINYVLSATAKNSNWNAQATNNLNAFLLAVSRGISQGKSLEQIVEQHGKFSYNEFLRRCRA